MVKLRSPTLPSQSPRLDQSHLRSRRNFLTSSASAAALIGLGIDPRRIRADDDAAVAETKVEGAFMIAGGGNMPASVCKTFMELAGGARAKLVGIITGSDNAGDPSLGPKHYLELSMFDEDPDVTLLHTRNPEIARSPEFQEPLKTAGGVWIAGGKQENLEPLLCLEGALRDVVNRGGVVGGTSAGAAVMGGEKAIWGGTPEAPIIGQGFPFIHKNLFIEQHLTRNPRRHERLDAVVRSDPQHRGLGVADHTAVLVRGQICTVLGDGHVIICKPNIPQRVLKPGETFHLDELLK